MNAHRIIDYPGEGGAGPLSGCPLTGRQARGEGPFFSCNGQNYSKYGIEQAARALNLLVHGDAQAKFEKLLNDLVAANETIKSRAEETRELHAALEAAQAELERVQGERDKLADTLAKTKTGAAIVSAHVAKILNGKD